MTLCRSRGRLQSGYRCVTLPPGLSKPKHENNISEWFGPFDGDDLDTGCVNPVDAETCSHRTKDKPHESREYFSYITAAARAAGW
jgi:hypothetical protein